MWDSETNIDYLGVVSGKKKILLHKTCSAFTIPPKGVVLLFDLCDYQNYSKDSIWRNLGNHLNIEFGDGNCISPATIEKLVNSKNYSHLIWLSRRAWNTAKIDFIWILSHELQHLKRDIENHSLSLAGYFLYYNLNGMDIYEPKIPTTEPTEMDAELAAWRIVQKLFGKQKADSYVRKNTNIGKKQKGFQDLLEYGLNGEYDIYSKTVNLLRKYQTQFENKINQKPYYYSKIGSVDDLCIKLSSMR